MKLILSNASGVPIYEQIQQQVKAAVLSGELKEGEALPSLRTLAKDLKISVLTVTRAYTELEQEGFIYSVPGKGSFAAVMGGGDPKRRAELMEKLREIIAELRYLNVSDQEILALMQEGGTQ